ncbi:Type I restriction modification DNA specificity domain protein [Synechococcus sp. PCC 7335]|uniref:restriction endonuclease subunit S n=1 Tax=Synechococcus sp. (strain ATCC 29403 / PCC 7335) TaxID=91464 RepID=UPI00017ED928|nr:restriction endonuclease subunit S [Synechococcus sp. PCC 7335]EDX84908.1 Type I restriction modification DNA specificity domain protein [Synechococcus sp. PCC 7335]
MSTSLDPIIVKKRYEGITKPLSKLCHSITDCHHSTPKYTSAGKIVIRNFNIKNGRLILDNVSFTDEETYQARIARSKPEPGDLIITREAPMGEICIIPEGIECCLGQRMVLIKPDENIIDNNYLLYAILSEYVQKQILKSNNTGSIVSNLRIPDLEDLQIPIKEPQSQIAGILSALDAKIDLNNRINAELEAMAKTIYDYWFVQFDFPDENGKPYKSSGGKMVYNKTLRREIPEKWKAGTLEDLGKIVGGSTPSTKVEANFSENGIPWIAPNDLSNNVGNKYITKGSLDVTLEGIKDASLKLYPKGTVLLSSRAPIGYMAIARNKLTTNQGFKSFIPNNKFSTEFVFYAVKNSMKAIIQYASGSTFKEVSGTILKTINVCLPPPDIADGYTNHMRSTFSRQDFLEQENQQLTQLRDWLLPMLMNGQVTMK